MNERYTHMLWIPIALKCRCPMKKGDHIGPHTIPYFHVLVTLTENNDKHTFLLLTQPINEGTFYNVKGWTDQNSYSSLSCETLARYIPVIGEIFGHNQLRSKCLQVQPVTCSHPPVFLYKFGVYSINSSKMTGNFPAVWIFYLVIPQTQSVHL